MIIYATAILSLVLVFVKRFQFHKGLYPFVFAILGGQVYFLRREFLRKKRADATEGFSTLHTLDTESLKVAYMTPLKMKKEIEPSLNAFVKSTKSDDDTVFLSSQKKKYANIELRRAWKEIDYLLEKTKVFSPKIYAAIVPKLTQEQIETDKEREEKEEMTDGGDDTAAGNIEEVRKERDRKETAKRLKKEIVEEQRL